MEYGRFDTLVRYLKDPKFTIPHANVVAVEKLTKKAGYGSFWYFFVDGEVFWQEAVDELYEKVKKKAPLGELYDAVDKVKMEVFRLKRGLADLKKRPGFIDHPSIRKPKEFCLKFLDETLEECKKFRRCLDWIVRSITALKLKANKF